MENTNQTAGTQVAEAAGHQREEDTRKLLRECNAGIKMGMDSIDEVMPSVRDDRLRRILEQCRREHADLGDETHELLLRWGADTKDPHPIAKGMSWLTTNVKLQWGQSDKTVAGIMSDGCHMGVKSLNGYLNEYADADSKARSVTRKLIDIEERMSDRMTAYL